MPPDKRTKYFKSCRSYIETPRPANLLRRVPGLRLDELQSIIDEARQPAYIDQQAEVVEACLQRILRESSPTAVPRPEQVRTMRLLIYGHSDVLLIARTGFGKSLIFQAYSILTGLATIQIIPMSKLGEEQFQGIERLPGTRPCLITYINKRRNRKLLEEVATGQFTHILLGPEQACSKEFRNALKSVAFRNRIGLLAIDEAHYVRQWGAGFRVEFAALGELRILLPRDVVWFACTATASEETRAVVLGSVGFRPVGLGEYRTTVIQTSVNRPEIALVVLPISRHMSGTGKGGYPLLFFLLNKAVEKAIEDPDVDITSPRSIPKTVIFIDGRAKISMCVRFLRQMLMEMTKDAPVSQRYTTDEADPQLCVYNVVQEFTAHVAAFDQKTRFTEFEKPNSITRVMVATTILGTGINVPDIDVAVVWDIPLDQTLDEIWQRAGRVARATGRTGVAYIFLPYWLFDTEGVERPHPSVAVTSTTTVPTKQYARGRGRGKSKSKMGPSHNSNSQSQEGSRSQVFQPSQSSGLRFSYTPGDVSDTESVAASCISDAGSVLSSQGNRDKAAPDGTLYWTDMETKKRTEIGRVWLELANSLCYRWPILRELGEHILPGGGRPDGCLCNGSRCQPSLTPELTPPPKPALAGAVARPNSNSRGWVALLFIDAWAAERAEEIYCSEHCRFPMPPSAGMLDECRWQLTIFYRSTNTFELKMTTTFEELCTRCDRLEKWQFKDRFAPLLVPFLYSIIGQVDTRYNELKAERAVWRINSHIEASAIQATPLTPSEISSLTTVEYNQRMAEEDRLRASVVASRHGIPVDRVRSVSGRARQMLSIVRGEADTQYQATTESIPPTPIVPVTPVVATGHVGTGLRQDTPGISTRMTTRRGGRRQPLAEVDSNARLCNKVKSKRGRDI